MDGDVDFVACDLPAANRFMLHILAAVAEQEALAISQRTTAALAAKKARGGLLGASIPACRNLRADDRPRALAAAAATIKRRTAEADKDVRPLMFDMRSAGASLQMIADTLNEQGMRGRRDALWNPSQVRRVLGRA
jgi:DNA invertase Pin-like site-specific DNA recombinase